MRVEFEDGMNWVRAVFPICWNRTPACPEPRRIVSIVSRRFFKCLPTLFVYSDVPVSVFLPDFFSLFQLTKNVIIFGCALTSSFEYICYYVVAFLRLLLHYFVVILLLYYCCKSPEQAWSTGKVPKGKQIYSNKASKRRRDSRVSINSLKLALWFMA